ncbi:MAG: TetR/AcrR family transcriptional regulator [Rikenellaceae bacterium]|nr:TetR/AcrR family transcriptional regulator [Rikenellaceae bacterium]
MSLKERIIAETTEMFVTYGIKSIRMDDIAANLGVSKRTIYEIFTDKENLLLECMKYHMESFSKRKREILDKATNVIEEMLMLLEDWDHHQESNHKMMTNLRKFYPKVYSAIMEEGQEKGYAALREKISAGVRDGYLLDNINYDLAVSIFTNSIYGIMSRQTMILPKNVSEKDAYKYVITYFFRGIATEKGIKMIDDYIEKEREKLLNEEEK